MGKGLPGFYCPIHNPGTNITINCLGLYRRSVFSASRIRGVSDKIAEKAVGFENSNLFFVRIHTNTADLLRLPGNCFFTDSNRRMQMPSFFTTDKPVIYCLATEERLLDIFLPVGDMLRSIWRCGSRIAE